MRHLNTLNPELDIPNSASPSIQKFHALLASCTLKIDLVHFGNANFDRLYLGKH